MVSLWMMERWLEETTVCAYRQLSVPHSSPVLGLILTPPGKKTEPTVTPPGGTIRGRLPGTAVEIRIVSLIMAPYRQFSVREGSESSTKCGS